MEGGLGSAFSRGTEASRRAAETGRRLLAVRNGVCEAERKQRADAAEAAQAALEAERKEHADVTDATQDALANLKDKNREYDEELAEAHLRARLGCALFVHLGSRAAPYLIPCSQRWSVHLPKHTISPLCRCTCLLVPCAQCHFLAMLAPLSE